MTLSALRPQSATMFTATLTDPDSVSGDNPTGSTSNWCHLGVGQGQLQERLLHVNIETATATSRVLRAGQTAT